MISICYYYALIGFIPALLFSLFAANDFRYKWEDFLDVDVSLSLIVVFSIYWAIWPIVTVVWFCVSSVDLVMEHNVFRRTLFNMKDVIDFFRRKKDTTIEN